MIKNLLIAFISCMGFLNWSYSQNVIDREFIQNKIPKEQVYLHINSSLLFSGEKLLYKFYSINPDSKKLSNLSKTGWVVLVNSDRDEVFHHKLNLDHGQAYSDFFIPSDMPSGAYKILGYTSWMQNAEKNYFEQDIHIFNPYQEVTKSLIFNDKTETITQNIKTQLSNKLSLKLNKNSFTSREEVVLSLENTKEIKGDFSISVRRIDDFDKPSRIESTNFSELYNNIVWNFSDTLILPEIRGSLFRGKISRKDKEILETNNLIVSFPGEESQLNIVSVDENNEFNFTVNNEVTVDEILFQLVDYNKNDFSVKLYKGIHPEYSKLNFDNQPIVRTNLKDYILERSVNNQIENAYSANKADQINIPKHKGYFFQGELLKFNLDEYKRFPSVTETFVEIIKYGWIKKNKDDTYSIFVRNKNYNGQFTLPALLIIDGVVIQNHNKLVSFNAERIQSIGLLTSKIFLGPKIFQGVVTIETKEGDFPEEFKEAYIKSANIITAQNPKQYYSPNYKKEDLERIPDYRYQLWWNPEVNFKKNESLRFFTSDLVGKFEINLEGFTLNGEPISISKVFQVE
jgi:hypothetical protein